MSEKQDWFFGMINDSVGEVRLVIQDQRNVILARNIFGGDDRELVPGNVARKRDVLYASARDRTAHSCAVEHLGKGDVVNIERLAGDFFAPLFARGRFSD
jgi:hypothetical protein